MKVQLMIVLLAALIAAAYACACTREYRPVCDNKGRTHGNQCMFKCFAAKELKNSGEGLCFNQYLTNYHVVSHIYTLIDLLLFFFLYSVENRQVW